MRLIDADAFFKKICELCGGDCNQPNPKVTCPEWNLAQKALEQLPTVDAVEVVRCKDCRYSEVFDIEDDEAGYYCFAPQHKREYLVFSGDYCSEGERREDAEVD